MAAKTITIISKYFLPNVNVDSDAVYDMIKGLLTQNPNVKITVVSSDVTYKGDFKLNSKYSPSILENIVVLKVKPFFSKSKMISDLILGFQLVSKAKKVGNMTIISLSNPPLISLWHSLMLKKYNLYYWTFDIFPEALVADRLIKAKSLFYKLLRFLTYRIGPIGLISLGKYQYNYLRELYGKDCQEILLPCGIHNNEEDAEIDWIEENKIHIGYLGNIGRAHSPEFLENVLKSGANSPNLKFILSIYGFHSNRIKDFAKNLDANNIFFVPAVTKGQLKFIDIHLVSLLPEWANISVPSKAVSAVCSGSALWYCGPKQVDTFGYFKDCSFISSEDLESVQATLMTINNENILFKKKKSECIKEDLISIEKRAYKNILTFTN